MFKLMLGFLLPFFGTVLGSAVVFFVKDKLNPKFEQVLLGLAGGMMMSASIWSLIIPALEQEQNLKNMPWLPATIGFVLGVVFLLIVELWSNKYDNKLKGKKTGNMLLAITIHNIPEGMAVGVALAGAYYGNEILTLASAVSLAVGIAIQNFPDGAIVSLPLFADGRSKSKSFWIGVMSGVLELACAVIAFFLTELLTPILPYILSFAGGATIFVVVKDLIPSSQSGQYTNWATISFAVGFLLMMLLDVCIV